MILKELRKKEVRAKQHIYHRDTRPCQTTEGINDKEERLGMTPRQLGKRRNKRKPAKDSKSKSDNRCRQLYI